MDATALLFFEQQRETPSEPWSSRQLRKIAGGLRDLNVRIEQKEFFVDDCFSLADISVASVLGMQDMLEQTGVASGLQSMAPSIVDWRTKYPLLERFYTQLSMRPSVKSTAPMMFELSETVV